MAKLLRCVMWLTVCLSALSSVGCAQRYGTTSGPTIIVGAVYPLTGPQGAGGREELAGVRTAVRLINERGGVGGRPVGLDVRDAATPAAGVAAVDALARQHVPLILGGYSSVMAFEASAEANRHGTVWWETGAVADDLTMPPGESVVPYVFRTVAVGSNLGRMSARFTDEVLLPRWNMSADQARVVIVYEQDVYGRSVAAGASAEAAARGLKVIDRIPYDPASFQPADIAQRVADARPDFLWDASYLSDGIALWRAIAASPVRLKGAIGTSSAFCMPEFGAALGRLAEGLYASDKPDADINTKALSVDAKVLFDRATTEYKKVEHHEMGISALAGFVGAWALLHDVAPRASSLTADSIKDAAHSIDLPYGSSINGAGLRFGAPGSADAGQNQRAASVVWQWQGGRQRVVYPASYQTAAPIVAQLP